MKKELREHLSLIEANDIYIQQYETKIAEMTEQMQRQESQIQQLLSDKKDAISVGNLEYEQKIRDFQTRIAGLTALHAQ